MARQGMKPKHDRLPKRIESEEGGVLATAVAARDAGVGRHRQDQLRSAMVTKRSGKLSVAAHYLSASLQAESTNVFVAINLLSEIKNIEATFTANFQQTAPL